MLEVHQLLHLNCAIRSVSPVFFAPGTDVLSVYPRPVVPGCPDRWQPGSPPTLLPATLHLRGGGLLQETRSLHYPQGLEYSEHAIELKGPTPRDRACG